MRLSVPALLSVVFLSGCAVPPAVSVVSLVADGVSYVLTGKNTTDHAISAVVGQDCALIRVVRDKDICDPDGEVLVKLVRDDPAEENWANQGDFYLPDNEVIPSAGYAGEIATVEPQR